MSVDIERRLIYEVPDEKSGDPVLDEMMGDTSIRIWAGDDGNIIICWHGATVVLGPAEIAAIKAVA